MHIEVGDLVKCISRGQKIGLVVDKKASNDGLEKSMHVRHMLNVYPKVYYVFFYDEGRVGPFHESEVHLQQTRHTTISSIV
jgi:hypothetical protein